MAEVSQAWEGIDIELNEGDGGNSESSATVYYIVSDAEDELDACSAAWEFAPSSISSIPKKSVAMSERLADTMWKIEVRYGTEDNSGSSSSSSLDDDDPIVNFDCSGGTKHVTQAISQECVYAGSGETEETESVAATVPIGWNGKTGAESEAAGVDISIGELRETYTKSMSRSSVTSTSWKRNVAELVGKVNSGSFKGWSAGEVMFLGCSYSAPLKGSSSVSVSFHFQVRMNESGAKVAGHSVGSVKGFEYLWAITDDQVVDGERQRKIRKIYKATVCESASFSSLGL